MTALMPIINRMGDIVGLSLAILALSIIVWSVFVISECIALILLRLAKQPVYLSLKKLSLLPLLMLPVMVLVATVLSVFYQFYKKMDYQSKLLNYSVTAIGYLVSTIFVAACLIFILKKWKGVTIQRKHWMLVLASIAISLALWIYLFYTLQGYIMFGVIGLLPIAIVLLFVTPLINKKTS